MAGPFLIIGGTKFIGPFVVRQLAAFGHEATVYHRGESESDLPASVRHVRSPAAAMPVRSFPDELFHPPPDTVIHMIPTGEEDARAALAAFSGCARRMIWLSSGDVYPAYGRFMRIEAGSIDNALLNEDAPLRTVLYPYRAQAKSPDDLMYSYDKILVERVALSDPMLPGTVLRLPKVYGPGSNADLATIYQARDHQRWRWTHAYVENVAAAIVLAATHPAATGRIYNVGEEHTPTIAERLARLPLSPIPALPAGQYNFDQDIAYDTSRIRRELGYSEAIPEEEGIRRTLSPVLR